MNNFPYSNSNLRTGKYSLKLITAPTVEPLTLDEAKAHLRVTTSEEDSLITADIIATRNKAENITGRALVTQTWEYYADSFPQSSEPIYIPKAPLQSITSISYIDSDGATQTLSSLLYKVDVVSEPGRIVPVYGQLWPTSRLEINAVMVRFVCGYGAAAAVPQSIKNWMLMQIGTLYDVRESIATGAPVQEVNYRWVDGLLDEHVLPRQGV